MTPRPLGGYVGQMTGKGKTRRVVGTTGRKVVQAASPAGRPPICQPPATAISTAHVWVATNKRSVQRAVNLDPSSGFRYAILDDCPVHLRIGVPQIQPSTGRGCQAAGDEGCIDSDLSVPCCVRGGCIGKEAGRMGESLRGGEARPRDPTQGKYVRKSVGCFAHPKNPHPCRHSLCLCRECSCC